MSEIEPLRVLNKLDLMTDYLERLKRFESITLEVFLGDRDVQLVVERLLQLIIQVAIDINRYLLKQLEIEQPDSNFDLFIEVGKQGIITRELAGMLAESGSFRNRLVHLYDEIDPARVHQAIQKALQNYPTYQRQITSYLDSLEADNG